MRVLSPVSIDLYDEFGHHTGIATTTPDGIPRIEENIPNSYYFEFGEGKYAGADSPNVKVYLNGQAEGTFTLDIDNIEGDTVVSSTSFVNVPVTPSSLASLAISEGQNISLQLDSGGDGVIEQSLSPGEYTAPAPLAETPRPSAGGKRSVQSVTKATEAKPSVGEVKTPVVYVVAIRPQQAPARVAQTLVKSVVEQNLQARAQQRSLAATAEALPKGLFKGVLSKLSKWLKGWSW